MATDSVVTFKYSDGVPLLTLYVKSDSHLNKFIPALQNAVSKSEAVSRRRGWDYTVAEIVSNLIKKKHFHSLIKVAHIHYEPENCNTIYRHVVSIKENYYDKQENMLKDFVTIESEYPIGRQKIAECLLFEFPKDILK